VSATPTPTTVTFLAVSADLLARGHQVRFQATGSSMYPTIRDKDVITVAAADAAGIKKGDIVLYRLGQGVIAHRVVGIEQTDEGVARRVTFRGDSADLADAPVVPDQILGRVLAVDRAGRHINLVGQWAGLRQRVRASASKVKRVLRGFSPPADVPSDP